MATSVRLLTAVLNSYGVATKDVSEVSDILFTTINLGVVRGSELWVGQEQAEEIFKEARAGLVEWRAYTSQLRTQLDDPQVKRGMGLLLRSGDDLARTIKKANVTIDNLSAAITETNRNINLFVLPAVHAAAVHADQHINNELIPAAIVAIAQTTEAVKSGEKILGISGRQEEAPSSMWDHSINQSLSGCLTLNRTPIMPRPCLPMVGLAICSLCAKGYSLKSRAFCS